MKYRHLFFKRVFKLAITIMVVFNLPGVSFSQIVNDTAFLTEVVITASKSVQSMGNITQKIDILSAREIENAVTGNRNISEVLQNQAGLSVTTLSRNDANWGTYSGIGPKYSTFMLQGLPIDAFMDPMALDLAAIERIEVQRGPASVIYPGYLSQDFAGNQSPLAGTVNLIPKERFEKPLSRFITSFGSYNTLNGQFYHQDISKNTHYYAGISYEMSDYTNYGTPDSWLNMQKNPEYRKTKAFGGATWFSDDNKQKLSIFVNKTFHAGDAGRLYRGFDHNYGLINAGYSVKIDENVNLQAHFGYRTYDRTWQESRFNVIDSLLSNNGAVQHIVPADVTITINHGKAHVLTTGIDYQGADYLTFSDPLLGYDTYGNKSKAMQAGIFIQEELHFGKLIARGGLRGNYINNNIEFLNGGAPGEESKDWMKLLYSTGLRYNVMKNVSIFANIGNSFITPGLKSVGGTIQLNDTVNNGQLPNPDLKPEAGLGVDAGADILLPLDLLVSVRVFDITVDEAIVENVVSQNPSQTQSINAGKTKSTGIEFEVSQKYGEQFNWFANATFMKTSVENPADEDQDGATVPFSPEIVANAGFSYKAPFGLQITPSLNYNAGFYDSSSKTGRKKFVPGALVNAYISQSIINNDQTKISGFLQLYNLLNNEYEMPWQFKNTGFSFMAGLSATF
jgi:outer membrane receptor protein involved in Fe transport